MNLSKGPKDPSRSLFAQPIMENDIRISRIYDNKGNENALGLTKKPKHDR